MKTLTLVLFVALLGGLCVSVYSATVGIDADVPEPYRKQMTELRDNNFELMKQCADLQKQEAELTAQQNWNTQRINQLGTQAVVAAGISTSDHQINLDRMKIEKRKKIEQPIVANWNKCGNFVCSSQ